MLRSLRLDTSRQGRRGMFRATFFAIIGSLLMACGSGSLDVQSLATSTPIAPTATPTPRATATPVSTPQRTGTPVTLADVQPFIRSYVRAKWNYLSGAGTARSLYDLFSPDCQRMVS